MQRRLCFNKSILGKLQRAASVYSVLGLLACSHLKSSSGIHCSQFSGEWGVLVAARCLDGSSLHLPDNTNLQSATDMPEGAAGGEVLAVMLHVKQQSTLLLQKATFSASESAIALQATQMLQLMTSCEICNCVLIEHDISDHANTFHLTNSFLIIDSRACGLLG